RAYRGVALTSAAGEAPLGRSAARVQAEIMRRWRPSRVATGTSFFRPALHLEIKRAPLARDRHADARRAGAREGGGHAFAEGGRERVAARSRDGVGPAHLDVVHGELPA